MNRIHEMTDLTTTRCVVALCVLTLTGAVTAQDKPVDKSGYTLFNPTPRELMRDLSADRPDATESPITVDAGHVQIEASFFDYTHNDDDGEETNTWTVMDTNIKLGLTNYADLQFVFGAYTHEQTESGGSRDTVDGFGDVQLRLKMNLWGNDEGDTAFGIMPFIQIPTGTELSSDHVEGGFIAMFGWDVADNWGIGLQAEVDAVYDGEDEEYDTEFSHTAVLGFDVVGPLGAYVEYVGIISTDGDADYDALFSGGLTYAINDDTQLDVGTQIGLTDDTDDVKVFTGITIRF